MELGFTNDGRVPSAVAAKILDAPALAATRERLRRGGRRLVQCHGCFDIVHPGHIRHQRQARSLGDVLLVSITGDAAIRKGTGRPLIPEELRAENLAALDCVDYVHVEAEDNAVALLGRVRPDVYVKGKEYETNADPRFAAERAAVEQGGGRVVFSSGDVVFSSTTLVAALERSADPYHQRLVQLSTDPALAGPDLYRVISGFRDRRMVVVGETILDTYILCDRPEVAGESPVMTLRPLEARHYDGGAAIVARHAAALGARPVLVTALPATDAAAELRRRLESQGIEVRAVKVRTPVPEKQRFLVGAQKIMKLDLVEPFVLDGAQRDELNALACDAARGGCDAGVITDFGLGLFSPTEMGRLTRALRPLAGVLAGDVSGKRSSLRAMHALDLCCPSEVELRGAMGLHDEGLPLVTWRLLEETGTRGAIVTMGGDGLLAFTRRSGDGPDDGAWRSRLSGEHVPALAPIALDALGCGDSLLAVAALVLAGGGTMLQAGFLGACAAGTQVQRLGNIPVTPADLRHMIARVHTAHLTYSGAEAMEARSGWPAAPRRAG